MPMPPILPVLEWRKIFFEGVDFQTWLKHAESEANRERIATALHSLDLEPVTIGFLQSIRRPIHIIAIAEDWCGDVVRHVPMLEKLAEYNENILTRYITRMAYPDVFARYLTNGGEAIPKFVFLNHEFIECGNWGPMPALCREIIARGKACGNVSLARKKVSALYAADSNLRMVAEELRHLLEIALSTSV